MIFFFQGNDGILPFRKLPGKDTPKGKKKCGLYSTSWSAEKIWKWIGFGQNLPKGALNFCLFNKTIIKWLRAVLITVRYFSRDSGNNSEVQPQLSSNNSSMAFGVCAYIQAMLCFHLQELFKGIRGMILSSEEAFFFKVNCTGLNKQNAWVCIFSELYLIPEVKQIKKTYKKVVHWKASPGLKLSRNTK